MLYDWKQDKQNNREMHRRDLEGFVLPVSKQRKT